MGGFWRRIGVLAVCVAGLVASACAGGATPAPPSPQSSSSPSALRGTPGYYAVSGDPGDPGGWAVYVRDGTWTEYRVVVGDAGIERIETHRYAAIATPQQVGATISVASGAVPCARGCTVLGGTAGGFRVAVPERYGGVRSIAFTPEDAAAYDRALAQARAAVQDHNRQVGR